MRGTSDDKWAHVYVNVDAVRAVRFSASGLVWLPEMLECAAAWLRDHNVDTTGIQLTTDEMGTHLVLYIDADRDN